MSPINAGMMSSTTPEWATPQDLFDKLNAEFGPFDLDPCATAKNAKCAKWYGWSPMGGGALTSNGSGVCL